MTIIRGSENPLHPSQQRTERKPSIFFGDEDTYKHRPLEKGTGVGYGLNRTGRERSIDPKRSQNSDETKDRKGRFTAIEKAVLPADIGMGVVATITVSTKKYDNYLEEAKKKFKNYIGYFIIEHGSDEVIHKYLLNIFDHWWSYKEALFDKNLTELKEMLEEYKIELQREEEEKKEEERKRDREEEERERKQVEGWIREREEEERKREREEEERKREREREGEVEGEGEKEGEVEGEGEKEGEVEGEGEKEGEKIEIEDFFVHYIKDIEQKDVDIVDLNSFLNDGYYEKKIDINNRRRQFYFNKWDNKFYRNFDVLKGDSLRNIELYPLNTDLHNSEFSYSSNYLYAYEDGKKYRLVEDIKFYSEENKLIDLHPHMRSNSIRKEIYSKESQILLFPVFRNNDGKMTDADGNVMMGIGTEKSDESEDSLYGQSLLLFKYNSLKFYYNAKKYPMTQEQTNELFQFLIQTDPVNFLYFLSRYTDLQKEEVKKDFIKLLLNITDFDPHPNYMLESFIKEIVEKDIQQKDVKETVKTMLNLLGFDYFRENDYYKTFKDSFYSFYPQYKDNNMTSLIIAALNQNPENYDEILSRYSGDYFSNNNARSSNLSDNARNIIISKLNDLANTDYNGASKLRLQLLGLRIINAVSNYEKLMLSIYGFNEKENGLSTNQMAKELIDQNPEHVFSILSMNRKQLQEYAGSILGNSFNTEPPAITLIKGTTTKYFDNRNIFYLRPDTFRKKIQNIFETIDTKLHDKYTKKNNFLLDEYYETLQKYGYYNEFVDVKETKGYKELKKSIVDENYELMTKILIKKYPENFYTHYVNFTNSNNKEILSIAEASLKVYRKDYNPSKVSQIIERQLNKGKTEVYNNDIPGDKSALRIKPDGEEKIRKEIGKIREKLRDWYILLKFSNDKQSREYFAAYGFKENEGGLNDDQYKVTLLKKYPDLLEKIISLPRSQLDAYFGTRAAQKKEENNYQKELTISLNKINSDPVFILAKDFLIKNNLIYQYPIDVSLKEYKDYINENKPITAEMEKAFVKEMVLKMKYDKNVDYYLPIKEGKRPNLTDKKKFKYISKLNEFEKLPRVKFSVAILTIFKIINNSGVLENGDKKDFLNLGLTKEDIKIIKDNIKYDDDDDDNTKETNIKLKSFLEVNKLFQYTEEQIKNDNLRNVATCTTAIIVFAANRNIDSFKPFMIVSLPEKVDAILTYNYEALIELYFEALFKKGNCLNPKGAVFIQTIDKIKESIRNSRRSPTVKQELLREFERLGLGNA